MKPFDKDIVEAKFQEVGLICVPSLKARARTPDAEDSSLISSRV
jgi:hypothetical protein